jgi:hypothetical protein
MPAPLTANSFARVTAKSAQDVCTVYKPAENAHALLRPDLTPRQFFDLLLVQQLEVEAGRFLAQALPKREAVWWACTCVRQTSGAAAAPKAAAALVAAETWVVDPTEANRLAAQKAAELANGLGSPAGCAAMAAFWSGGSLAPTGMQVIAPAESMTATAVTGALIRVALLNAPEKFLANLRGCLTVGVAVATGTNRWKEPSPPPGSRR